MERRIGTDAKKNGKKRDTRKKWTTRTFTLWNMLAQMISTSRQSLLKLLYHAGQAFSVGRNGKMSTMIFFNENVN